MLLGSAPCRGVAQPGSAPVLGTGGPQFESGRPDQFFLRGRLRRYPADVRGSGTFIWKLMRISSILVSAAALLTLSSPILASARPVFPLLRRADGVYAEAAFEPASKADRQTRAESGSIGVQPIHTATPRPEDAVSPLDYSGADATCAADSTVAVMSALAALRAGGILDIGRNCFLIGNITIPANVQMRGTLGMADPYLSAASGLTTSPYAWPSQLRTLPGTTITVSNGARITGLLLIPQRLGILPATNASQADALVAAFAGTAITGNHASAEIDHNAILGYAQAINLDNTGGVALSNKANIHENMIDATNGVRYANSGDRGEIAHNHIFPFLTMAVPGVSPGRDNTAMQRRGKCIFIDGPDTASTVFGNLCFGYTYGGYSSGSSAVMWLRNHFENLGGSEADTGMFLVGDYTDVAYNFVLGYKTGIYVARVTARPAFDNFKLSDNTIAVATCAIHQASGYVIGSDNLLQSTTLGVLADNAATGGLYRGNRMVGVAKGFSISSTAPFVIRDNPGYNPVGPVAISPPPASGLPYKASASPETIYMSASGGISAITENAVSILPMPVAANVSITLQLDPNEVITPSYGGTLVMRRVVH